jgi:hypothetical protein
MLSVIGIQGGNLKPYQSASYGVRVISFQGVPDVIQPTPTEQKAPAQENSQPQPYSLFS